MSTKRYRNVIRPDFGLFEGWAYPILNALNETDLVGKQEWRETALVALSLAIETRLQVLASVKARLNKSWGCLREELDAEPEIGKFVNHYGFRFKRRAQLTQLQAHVHSYSVEARACFFILAKFYRGFVSNYLTKSVGKADSYEHIAQLGTPRHWSETLENVRNNIAHGDTPWLQFELLKETPMEYEILIDFNGTPRNITRNDPDVVTLSQLFEIEPGLERARTKLRDELISDIKASDRRK